MCTFKNVVLYEQGNSDGTKDLCRLQQGDAFAAFSTVIKYTIQIVHAGSCALGNAADTSRAGARVCPNGHGSRRKIHLLK